jgi:hypothetical protein
MIDEEVQAMSDRVHANFTLDRMVRAVEKVRDRLLRASAALESAGIPYAVVGGNAVAAWVAQVDEAAVRNTQDVDILLRREDLERAKVAMGAAGFIYRHVKSIDMFLDGPGARARDAVHVLFAGEFVRRDDLAPAPEIGDSEVLNAIRAVKLEALLSMKLTAFRDKDRVHVRDMIDVGLVDESWCDRLPPPLAARLRELLETPDG